MKQSIVFNKKWILTASLLAALGTQYSFENLSTQTNSIASSKNYGEFVLASTSSPDNTKAVTTSAKTEAASTTECPTGECGTTVLKTKTLSVEEYTQLLTKISDLEKMLTTQPGSDCEKARPDETREERRERIACEKEEKKQAKIDKLKEKEEIRIEKFEDKMQAIKDKCDQDVECLSSEFSSALSRYEGKNSVPNGIVLKALNSVVGSQLKKDLFSSDIDARDKSNAALQSLMQDMPDQYKGLKQSVISAVKNLSTAEASKVSQKYAAVNALSKQNKPQEYFQALSDAQAEHNNYAYTVNTYSSSIANSLQTAEDSSTLAYYQKSYVPDMQKIMMSIVGGNVQNNTTTPTTTVDPASNTRGGRSSDNNTTTTTVENNNSRTNTDKMTRDNNSWIFPNENSGLKIGSPSNQSRGGRGPRQ